MAFVWFEFEAGDPVKKFWTDGDAKLMAPTPLKANEEKAGLWVKFLSNQVFNYLDNNYCHFFIFSGGLSVYHFQQKIKSKLKFLVGKRLLGLRLHSTQNSKYQVIELGYFVWKWVPGWGVTRGGSCSWWGDWTTHERRYPIQTRLQIETESPGSSFCRRMTESINQRDK